MTRHLLLLGLLSISSLPSAETPHEVTNHTSRDVEGWQVRVDQRLLQAPDEALGKDSLALLSASLADIKRRLSADRIAALQKVSIVLDLSCGSLKSMQYHPSVKWLEENGFPKELERCVHIPMAGQFVNPAHHQVQPWCIMHELAHAYHDQVLGFNEARIKKAWENYVAANRGQRVLHINGRSTRHYAMTNEKEFFAEMTEAYLGTNDFYPFVYGELKQAEPEIFGLLQEIWGEVPVARY
jgi:hypothetical protein